MWDECARFEDVQLTQLHWLLLEVWDADVATHDEPLGWANLATTLVITASSEMTLGVPPEPGSRAANRLDEALRAIERAETLGSTDALLLNTRGTVSRAFGIRIFLFPFALLSFARWWL